MVQADKEAMKIMKTTTLIFILVIVIAVGMAIFLGWYTTKNIMQRINPLVDALHKGADGDLTTRIQLHANDELGRLGEDFNVMSAKLDQILCRVRDAVADLISIASNISQASKELVSAAELQSLGTGKASTSVLEIARSIKEVADNVDTLSSSAAESSSSILEIAASISEVAHNVEALAEAVEAVSSSIMEMAASAKQIGGNAANLSQSSAATVLSVEQMDNSIKQIEVTAQQTAAISEKVFADAKMGRTAVEATIAGMKEIHRAARVSGDVIAKLSERTENIGAILAVIDEVAEQTNLLALNAAIIAAQAGEQGKGFSVVADEIKELAERTTNSTREIANVIKGVQDETRRAVEAINDAERSINEGEKLSRKSGEALDEIASGAEKSTIQIGEIARATEEQAKGSRAIKSSISKMAGMIEEVAIATKEQAKGSDAIMAAVERMKLHTSQVKSSTREQANVGNFIAQSTENISSMIRHIKSACEEQTVESDHISAAVVDISQSSEVNLKATLIMDDSVIQLTRQIGVIEEAMAKFTVGGAAFAIDGVPGPETMDVKPEGTIEAAAGPS